MKLSICIEKLWPERPYDERLRRLAELGFTTLEFWGTDNKDLAQFRKAREELDLTFASMCVETGGPLTQPGADGDLAGGVAKSATFARELGIETLIITAGDAVAQETQETTWRRVKRRLSKLATAAQAEGMTLVLEPLNPTKDHVGHWINTVGEAADLVEAVDSPALRILFDIYHQQITEGDICRRIDRWLPLIGHFHAAGVPARGNLGLSELDYGFVFRHIARSGYGAYVGLEYTPQTSAEGSLMEARAIFDQAKEVAS